MFDRIAAVPAASKDYVASESLKLSEFLKTQPARSKVLACLRHPLFDYTMGAIIMGNFALIIAETDESATLEEGQEISPTSSIAVLGWSVLAIFIVELGLRLFAYRSAFWKDPWNKFDFVVVLTDVSFSIVSLVGGVVLPVSVLRIFRLCKVARASKLLRVLPELRLMVAGLMGSLKAIIWGTLLLTFVMVVWSVLAVQLIHPLNKDLSAKGVYSDCSRCSRAYSSVFQSTLTFTQQIVTGDSWGAATIPLIEHHPSTMIFFACVFLTVGMAVLNLILGVVVNVASQEHDNLQRELENEKRVQKMEMQNHLYEMCQQLDDDGNGLLSKAEMEHGFRTQEDFRKCFLGMDLQEEDIAILWTILDTDKAGYVSYEEFVFEVYKMKNSDAQFMLAYIKYYVTVIKDKIVEELQDVKRLAKETEVEAKRASQMITEIEKEELVLLSEVEAGFEAEMDPDLRNGIVSTQKDRKRERTPGLQCSGAAQSWEACLDDRRYTDSNPRSAEKVHGKAFESDVTIAASQVWRDVLDDHRVQGQLEDTMSKIQQNLELHASLTFRLLVDLLSRRSGPVMMNL